MCIFEDVFDENEWSLVWLKLLVQINQPGEFMVILFFLWKLRSAQGYLYFTHTSHKQILNVRRHLKGYAPFPPFG